MSKETNNNIFKESHENKAITNKQAIYKTWNTETGNVMPGMRGTRGMFTRIPGNLLEDSRECRHFNISGGCSRGFQGTLLKIPGNVQEDSRECYKRLPGMLLKTPEKCY